LDEQSGGKGRTYQHYQEEAWGTTKAQGKWQWGGAQAGGNQLGSRGIGGKKGDWGGECEAGRKGERLTNSGNTRRPKGKDEVFRKLGADHTISKSSSRGGFFSLKEGGRPRVFVSNRGKKRGCGCVKKREGRWQKNPF